MRLKQRRNVLLPQPDGPISAVTWFSGIVRLMFLSAWFVPYQKSSFSAMAFGRGRARGLALLHARWRAPGVLGLVLRRFVFISRASHQLIFLRKR